jgi:hypothetical protein
MLPILDESGAGRLDQQVKRFAGAQAQRPLTVSEAHIDDWPAGDEFVGTAGTVGEGTDDRKHHG